MITGEVTVFLPGHKAHEITCNGSRCESDEIGVGSDGGGAPQSHIDVSDSRFTGDIRQPQDTIPIVDEGKMKYIFKSERYDRKLYFTIRRIEYPGGYAIDYETRLLVETIQVGSDDEVISPVRFLVDSMTDSFGRTITLDYARETWINTAGDTRKIPVNGSFIDHPETTGLLKKVTLPDLSTLNFTYDSVTDLGQEWNLSERLATVYRTSGDVANGAPAGQILSSETYHYENSGLPFALTVVNMLAELTGTILITIYSHLAFSTALL